MAEIDRLLDVMARLRDPERGCPWDREQDFASIAPYTIEEAYEVADAIARGDLEDLRDELGDLLLQVVYHAQMARESGHFGFHDVARAIADKLVRRHPHVFGDAPARSADAVRTSWEDVKASERAERRAARASAGAEGALAGEGAPDPFEGVPVALPALRRAAKIVGRSERAGLAADDPVLAAPPEEHLAGLGEHPPTAAGDVEADTRARLGDLLLSVVVLARRRGIDPDRALAERTRALEARARTRSRR